MIYVSRGILNGAGDAAYSMINGFMEITGRVGFCQAAYDDTGNWYVGRVPYDRIDMDTGQPCKYASVCERQMEK